MAGQDLRVDGTYKAIKIFTVEATTTVKSSYDDSPDASIELFMLLLISRPQRCDNVPALSDFFFETSSRGSHRCLVLSVLGPSVDTLRAQNVTGAYKLLLHITQKIIASVISTLYILHKNDVRHGVVTPGNILLNVPTEAKDIEEYLSNHPTAAPRADGVYPSQPLYLTDWDESASVFASPSVSLHNFKFAQAGEKMTPKGPIPSPEAIEVKLVHGATDTWMVGYTTYVLLTGKVPFDQHITLKELEDFVLNLPDTLPCTLASIDDFPPEDITPTVEFISLCLRWDPSERPSDLPVFHWIRDETRPCRCGSKGSPLTCFWIEESDEEVEID